MSHSPRAHSGRGPVALVLAVLSAVLVAGVLVAPAAEANPQRAGRLLSGAQLDALTIPELQEQMDARRQSSLVLTLSYLQRIREVDDEVNAVIALNPLAIAQAVASDLVRRTSGARSPLEGIPVLLKDNVDTRGRLMPTTAGSRAMGGLPSGRRCGTGATAAGCRSDHPGQGQPVRVGQLPR